MALQVRSEPELPSIVLPHTLHDFMPPAIDSVGQLSPRNYEFFEESVEQEGCARPVEPVTSQYCQMAHRTNMAALFNSYESDSPFTGFTRVSGSLPRSHCESSSQQSVVKRWVFERMEL